ncbi:hypothetical protein LEP1GSC016_2159 [Leptospira borgpetersenii serovar Hardjo-bovis str. Sponselee]|uniref:Uncharacterized protein n=1 Tax=Leptospira borgpetersenii serovar Hardjo-bovis str. Sponselee TaxID=1303729 RepID=M6BIF8_LEPBO|nr:hypothetical protein LBK6_11715 [Leptospira borgpetersenii serovar Hardjo]AWV70757.1 hypothetical protein B9T54_12630 [Leptospira borgpetersenii serovar Hardjo-bovis]EMJ78361.1 hypothetical protein LEP1GSC016_2159 [Leptospira borgpetersenii serovar Hardjo-bovis str. Sponselee]TQE51454.1 hypothetical protein FFZ95_14225 [Leptospira borgpetersenii]AMX62229.1 hypothetical protein LBK9_11755 [Leptospira borgpetersenii serovar Hardjo]
MDGSNVGTLTKSVKDGIYEFFKISGFNLSYQDTIEVKFRTKFLISSPETNRQTNPLLNISRNVKFQN